MQAGRKARSGLVNGPIGPEELIAVADAVIRLHGAIEQMNCVQVPGGAKLSPHQVRTVMRLLQRPGQTVSELAEAMGISAGWTSRIVDELAATDRVERRRDNGDRRVVRLWLTPHAQAMAQRIYQQRAAALARALTAVDPACRPAIPRFLGHLAAEIETLGEAPEAS